MRRLLAVAALGAAAGTAPAQSGTATGGISTTRAGGGATASMPGQVVGSGFNLAGSAPQPVGKMLPPAADPLSRPYDPSRPLDVFKGTGINPRQVIAPISAFPPIPGPEKNLIDRLYDKLDAALNVNFFSRKPEAVAAPMNVTPGIFRRNRERAQDRMWRPD
ncbi:hypothetical protein J0H58_28205 [bacterium]|nr:hypothetical protein [bacterium]